MALDVYYREDIGNSIVSLAVMAVATAYADGGHNVQFCAGALAAFRSMALAYRLDWTSIAGDIRLAVGAECVRALDDGLAMLDGGHT